MAIRILDAATIGRIAAGEVVERPLSVVKELVENSLDARATAITVEIREGGSSYLRVTDNGIGIPADEVEMAFQNHATSKLASDSDLSSIETLGFRGEALPSIAAVSHVEMTTCQLVSEHGTRIRISAGVIESLESCAAPMGTSVVVTDLFYNLPARRAFLRKKSTETALITELLTKLMLGNPSVAFRFITSDRTASQTFGDGNPQSAVLNLFGRGIAEKVVQISESEGEIKVDGWIGVGDCAKPTRSMQAFFINGRIVRCPLLSAALDDAAKGRVMVGTHPICALHITMPMKAVDVNAHPSKLEVRFRDEDTMAATMTALFERGMQPTGMLNLTEMNKSAPEIQAKPLLSVSTREAYGEINVDHPRTRRRPQAPKFTVTAIEELPVPRPRTNQTSQLIADQKLDGYSQRVMELRERDESTVDLSKTVEQLVMMYAPKPSQPNAPAASTELLFTVVGVAFKTYVIVECADMMLLIDQHAAHERLLFEHYMKSLDTQTVSQRLLTPLVVELLGAEMALLSEHMPLIAELGYDIEPFGDRTIKICAVPQILGDASDMKDVILSMLSELGRLKSALMDKKRNSIISIACKRAIKAGDKLNDEEIRALLTDMMESGAPPTCPHGRPVVHKMTRADLERIFRRV